MNPRPTILLVEDDENDAMLTLRSIRSSGLSCEVVVARDGAEASDLLFPLLADFQLILLDVSLPKMSGLELLERIRSNEQTRNLPVVVFTSSDEQRDLQTAANLYANSYVRKEMDLDIYESRLKLLLYYWLEVHEQLEPSLMRLNHAGKTSAALSS